MPFKKGHNVGRPKGSKSKTTESIRQAFITAFEKLGGVQSLVTWGKANETEFYRLIGRVLPKEVEISGPDGGPIEIKLMDRLAKALERTGEKKS